MAVDQRRCCHTARNAKHSKGAVDRSCQSDTKVAECKAGSIAPGIGTSVCKTVDQGPARPNFGPRLLSQKPEMREFQELSSKEPRCDADWYRRPLWTRAFIRHVGCFFRCLACVSGSRPLDLLLADGGKSALSPRDATNGRQKTCAVNSPFLRQRDPPVTIVGLVGLDVPDTNHCFKHDTKSNRRQHDRSV